MAIRRVLFAATALVILAGCTQQSTSQEETDGTWETQLEQIAAAAAQKGASQQQQEALRQGDISFDVYEAAVRRTIDCLENAGIGVIGNQVTEGRGFPEINYSYAVTSNGRTEEETDAISQSCITQHSLFIESAYRDRPQSQEAIDALFEPYEESILDCLATNGKQLQDGADRGEIERANADLMIESGTDCVADSGFLTDS